MSEIRMTWAHYRRRCCEFNGREIKLNRPRAAILLILLLRRGDCVPYAEIIDFAWPIEEPGGELGSHSLLRNQMCFLRALLPGAIETFHGVGFRIPRPDQACNTLAQAA